MDNSDEGDLTRPKGRKRRMSDKENGETWTRKKTKVSIPMLMINSLTSYFCTEGNGLAYQGSSWGKKVNSENICENHLAIGHQWISGSKKKNTKLTRLLPSHNLVRIVDKK